jgi:hypothetical protein
MLHQLYEFQSEITGAYETLNFTKGLQFVFQNWIFYLSFKDIF